MTTKFAFVCAEQGNYAVATLCRVVGASVSGFYAWLHARSLPSETALRRTPSCAATSAASSQPGAGSTARPGSTPSCAGKGGSTRADAWRG